MQPKELLDFLSRIEPLKSNGRHSVTAGGVTETVAAHSWRLAVLALLLFDEFPALDMNRVVRMCLVHDFGEAVTGDIPSFTKTSANEQTEEAAVQGLLSTLPAPLCNSLGALFSEMDAQQTEEARLYKALDKLEAVIQHNESDISSWIPLEYTLNRTYGEEQAAQFPFLKALRAQLQRDTDEKIRAAAQAQPAIESEPAIKPNR